MSLSLAKNFDEEMVSISRFNKGEASKIFGEVRKNGLKIVLKNNKREAIILSPEMYDALIDMVEDEILLKKAKARDKKGQKAVSFQSLAKEAGITPEDMEGYEAVELE